jgi:hypothetical protein
MKYKCGCDHHKLCASFLKYQGQKCLGAGYVSGPDMSQGWTCLRCLKLLLYKKTEKEQKFLGARLVQALLGQTCLRAGLVLGPDLSWGWTCLRSGLVSGLDLSRGQTCPKTSGPDLSKSFRAGSVSGPELSKSLGPEVSRGRTWFAAGLGSRPDLVRGRTSLGA